MELFPKLKRLFLSKLPIMIRMNILILSGILSIINLSCKKEEVKSSEKEIISFIINEQVGSSTISPDDALICAIVKVNVGIGTISPEITLSQGATIWPESGIVTDFSGGSVEYTVTAEDGSTKIWRVTVSNALRIDAEILSFDVAGKTAQATLEDGKVSVRVANTTDLTQMTPSITISDGATVFPESGQVVDFSNGTVTYTVTAEDSTQKQWIAEVIRATYTQANIISYTIPGQIGDAIIQDHSILIQVPFGTDLTSITPVASLSAGASVEPSFDVPIDLSVTGKVSYSITAENGNVNEWNVYISYPPISASSSSYQYIGRFDLSNPELPRVWASGAYIRAKFMGSYCSVVINDEVLWGNSFNYYTIRVNNREPIRVKSVGKVNYIHVASDLPQGEHTITITKDTESAIGYIEFAGISVEEIIPMGTIPDRHLEFIGNSITCGAESDLSVFSCNEGSWFDRHNAYKSYGAIVARALNADYHLASVSGIGMIQSCCGMDYVMADSYANIELNRGTTPWDFTAYSPHLVGITLGQNDGIQDSTQFCSAYVNFIQTVRANYPNAHILCLTSPMGNTALTNALKRYLNGIVSHMHSIGDEKVHMYAYSRSYNRGCGGHPDVSDHSEIANELKPVIQSILGWD
jgi:hypothetical protein